MVVIPRGLTIKVSIGLWIAASFPILLALPSRADGPEIAPITPSGGISAILLDLTPPTTPIVTDDGEETSNPAQLHATWSSDDPESGIAEYYYSITQDSPEGPVIVDWTSTGQEGEVTAASLRLVHNRSYYFGVLSVNGEGLWSSEVGYSDGIFYRDRTPPSVGITSPRDGDWIGGPS